jgi:long-chain-fatty-acid--CoA ligase ACSBG
MYGRHVFMGYLNEVEKTKETFDEDLYLMSGDIGKKDQDGFLYITGRKKGNHGSGTRVATVFVNSNPQVCRESEAFIKNHFVDK